MSKSPKTPAHPPLPRAEQEDLARRAASGDRRAAGELIRASRGFIASRVRKLAASRIRNDSTFEEDLISEAELGMFEALLRYDPTRNVHPLTYASHWIDLRIRKALTANIGPASVGPVKAWRNAGYPRSIGISLDAPVGPADGARRPMTLEDKLAADQDPADDVLADALELRGWRAKLDAAIDTLTPRERSVAVRRLLGDPPPTLKELGAELGISRERTRQVEIVAVNKVCDALGIRRISPVRLQELIATP